MAGTPALDTSNESPQCILLAGAHGGVGAALAQTLCARFPQAALLTISRHDIPSLSPIHQHLKIELENPASVSDVQDWLLRGPLPNWVVNCCGTLHWQDHRPEKSLRECDDSAMLHSFSINALTHLHLAQALDPLLKRRSPLTWASLSAKVGSIEDNHLGGWYSYRMSKAALNMLIRNLSIEWGRKLDSCKVVAIHPGTTDTPLSKPFQASLTEGKLFSPELSASRITDVIQNLAEDDTGRLLFWDGSPIPW
ncbi:SDR family NAD(P)-dependent oxidoreductase [Microbulbifer agarilyticus]|uniref:SDR family NAD(P)-dependent oxidoreductase n=1 Tax=Microbulbifer agarilyticus TaxID=260552 RepID=UPI001C961897|nr:SDR family NAD(P)-dependent oxidoreductase [Microbulbifer agarilyticus]MBY6212701.1 SDR family NAD(P)-dependent oxidoreductase [Microbulbifer agarilyticus]